VKREHTFKLHRNNGSFLFPVIKSVWSDPDHISGEINRFDHVSKLLRPGPTDCMTSLSGRGRVTEIVGRRAGEAPQAMQVGAEFEEEDVMARMARMAS